jgi:hypothetical protein
MKISKVEFGKIKHDRYKLLCEIVQKFIDEPLATLEKVKDNEWLHGIKFWAGNGEDAPFWRVQYGVFLAHSGTTSRGIEVFANIAKSLKGFGFEFESWSVRNGLLYLCFEEKEFEIPNDNYVDETLLKHKEILKKVKS